MSLRAPLPILPRRLPMSTIVYIIRRPCAAGGWHGMSDGWTRGSARHEVAPPPGEWVRLVATAECLSFGYCLRRPASPGQQ